MTFLQRWRDRGVEQAWPHDEETCAATNPVLRMTARAVPIAETQLRTPVVVTGRVTSVRVHRAPACRRSMRRSTTTPAASWSRSSDGATSVASSPVAGSSSRA